MGKIVSRIVNGVSDVISGPSRVRHEWRGSKFDYKRKIVRDARNYDNAPNYDEKGNITDAFKVRQLRKDIKNAN